MKNLFDAVVDFLRKENWVGALVVIVLAVAFLTRSDSKEEKAEYAKMYAICQEEKRVALALSTKREDALRAEHDKFKAELLDQYRKDKEANDKMIQEFIMAGSQQKKYMRKVSAQNKSNIMQTKKIESKLENL